MSSIAQPAVSHCPFAFPTHKCYELGCMRRIGASEPICVAKLRAAPERLPEDLDGHYFVQVCAWCGKVLRIQTLSEPSPSARSHGICETCRDKIMEQRRKRH